MQLTTSSVNGPAVAACICLVATSCRANTDDQEGASSNVIDSAGVTVVTSIRPVLGLADSWHTTESLVLGGVGGSSLFFKIKEARRLSDSRFVIISDAQVAIVDRSGRVIRPIGMRGSGPGEYQNPEHVRVSSPDNVFVWDVDYGPRITYDTNGTLLGEHHFDLDRIHEAPGDSVSSESHTPFGEEGLVTSLNFHEQEPTVGQRLELRRGTTGLQLIKDDYTSAFLGRVAGPLYFTFHKWDQDRWC